VPVSSGLLLGASSVPVSSVVASYVGVGLGASQPSMCQPHAAEYVPASYVVVKVSEPGMSQP
jgi:hypothetical protein